jgi:hypothetical protein
MKTLLLHGVRFLLGCTLGLEVVAAFSASSSSTAAAGRSVAVVAPVLDQRRQRRYTLAVLEQQPARQRRTMMMGWHSPTSRCFGFGQPHNYWTAAVVGLFSSQSDDDNDDQSSDEGAKLASELFQLAQRKGIRLDDTDMTDEDDEDDDEENLSISNASSSLSLDEEDDDDDDDDEPEPNIPQGAINAFLGYDTGNVGERLAGNVTLTNDQLYSEVKERVLDTVGGFLSYVQSADEDEDDEDDEDDETSSFIRETTEQAKQPYQAPTTVPDSDLTAGEVVIQVLDSLLHNDVPEPNRGVSILFGYSSPGSQIKNEVGLTPAEYAEFLKETEYKILFDHQGASIDKADYSLDGKKAFFTARLQSGPSPLDTVSVNFILSTTGREDDACWLIDSILIRPQSMRRRRRK